MGEDAQTLALLRSLDRLPGPDHLEFPDGFTPAVRSGPAPNEERTVRVGGVGCGPAAVHTGVVGLLSAGGCAGSSG